MGLWSVPELVIVSQNYASGFKDAKYKIGADGQLKNTKIQGTVDQFYKDISAALVAENASFKRTFNAIKSKEGDLVKWARRFINAIDQSGNSAVENCHYTFIEPSKPEFESSAKVIMNNLYAAFKGTPKIEPAVLEMGADGDQTKTVKQIRMSEKEVASQNNQMINTYLKRKSKTDNDSDLDNNDYSGGVAEFKRRKKEQELEMGSLNQLKLRAQIYKELRNAGLEHDLAYTKAGLDKEN